MSYTTTRQVPVLDAASGYSLWAPYYDQDTSYLNSFEDRELTKLIGHTAGLQVLDIGCGTGRISRQLDAGTQLTGLDICPEMLTIYQEHFPHANVVRASATDTGLPDAAFDLIIAELLLIHLPDPVPFYIEMERLLKPGGALIFSITPQRREPTLKTDTQKFRIKAYNHSPRSVAKDLDYAFLKLDQEKTITEYGTAINYLYRALKPA